MPKLSPLHLGIIGLVAVVVLGGGGFFAFKQITGGNKPAPSEAPQKRRVSEPVNVLPVAERPYVVLAPQADGRNIVLHIESLKKPAESAEYEIEYQAGSILQGAFGAIQLGTLPSETKVLLGSCSAGGACTYHQDVKGGTVLLRFSGESNYALKSEWRYFENKAKETSLASKDAKFQLASDELKKVPYAIVYNSPGFPGELPGTLVSDPYSLSIVGTITGQVEITMRATEEGQLEIVGWDGQKWQSFPTTTDGKTAAAKAPVLSMYAVIKK